MQAKVERNSSIELLRIISMLLIIGGHVVRFGTSSLGDYDSSLWYGGVDYAIGNLVYAFCIVAVNVFVLISGYFGISLNLSKLIKMEFQVLFYSLALLAVSFALGGVNLRELPSYLFPTLSSKWWFITTYMALCLISPLLNLIIEKISKKQMKTIVLTSFLMFYLWATISYLFNFQQFVPGFGGSIVNFVALYFTGRYIRLYYEDRHTFSFYLLCFVFTIIAMYILQLAFSWVLGFPFTSFANNDSIFVFVGALALFLAFRRLSFTNSVINRLAFFCLAVYIIHMNSIVKPMMIDFFNISQHHGIWIFVDALYIPLIVYLFCALIEYIRMFLLAKVETFVSCNISNKLKR